MRRFRDAFKGRHDGWEVVIGPGLRHRSQPAASLVLYLDEKGAETHRLPASYQLSEALTYCKRDQWREVGTPSAFWNGEQLW